MKPFFYYKGIKSLAKILRGDENIYLGIRPYGFHAGNALTQVVYPILLCKELLKQGKIPKFKFFVFINDWEQDRLAGPDLKMFPFNVHPVDTTFQYTFDLNNPAKNIVDYWEPVIISNIKKIKQFYPEVKIKSIRNSNMKKDYYMRDCLLKTIENPYILKEIIEKYSQIKVLSEPLSFAMAVCPMCKMVKGLTQYKNKVLNHLCFACGDVSRGEYLDFDYWFYHKPLALPRIKKYDIDLCITGADHYNEGDFYIRQDLIKTYNLKMKNPLSLYTPTVLGYDDKPMGKSRGNAVYLDPEMLLEMVNKEPNDETIKLKHTPNLNKVYGNMGSFKLDTLPNP